MPKKILTGVVVSDKPNKTITVVVERKYLNSTIGTLLNVLLKKAEAQAKNETSNVTIDRSLQSTG